MNPATKLDQILAIVESIPTGRVTTYGSIADAVEGATPRSVGHTLKTEGHNAPWWRVVNASGRPAPGVEHRAREYFSTEHTPLIELPDGTYSVDLAAAVWEVPEWGFFSSSLMVLRSTRFEYVTRARERSGVAMPGE